MKKEKKYQQDPYRMRPINLNPSVSFFTKVSPYVDYITYGDFLMIEIQIDSLYNENKVEDRKQPLLQNKEREMNEINRTTTFKSVEGKVVISGRRLPLRRLCRRDIHGSEFPGRRRGDAPPLECVGGRHLAGAQWRTLYLLRGGPGRQ